MEVHNSIVYGVIIICIILAAYLIYKYFKNSRSKEVLIKSPNINLRKCIGQELNNLNNNWKNTGFCKINNCLKDEVEYINKHVNFVETNFPNLTNVYFNNNVVKNIKRKTIELVRDKDGVPYPLSKSKQMNNDNLTPYSSLSEKDMSEELNNEDMEHNNEKDMDLFEKDMILYHKSSNKKEFIEFLGKFVDKLKQEYPNIVTKDLDIYHVLCFHIYPGGQKQDIHFDKFYLEDHKNNSHDNKLLNSLQIFIPLHNTPLEQGPTILYKRNMIDYELLRNNTLTNKIDEEHDIIKNNPDLLNMFAKAKTQEVMNKGDIIFMDKDVYHQGGENKSNSIRKTLLIQLA